MTDILTTENQIALEAIQAAAKWNDINAACPYPWGSTKSVIFKRHFQAEQQRLAAEAMNDPEPAEPFCACAHDLTPAELETLRCDECGKGVVA